VDSGSGSLHGSAEHHHQTPTGSGWCPPQVDRYGPSHTGALRPWPRRGPAAATAASVNAERVSRQHRRRHGCPLVRFPTLNVEPMRRVLSRDGHPETQGLATAMHICRGHFQDVHARRSAVWQAHRHLPVGRLPPGRRHRRRGCERLPDPRRNRGHRPKLRTRRRVPAPDESAGLSFDPPSRPSTEP